MSLSARDQQALEGIEDDLASSAPKLAAMLATFTRLTSGEEIPADEGVAAVRVHTPDVRKQFRRAGFRRVTLVLWGLIAITLLAITMAFSFGGREDTCIRPWATACGNPASTQPAGPASKAPPKTAPDQAPSAAHPVPATHRPAP